MREIRRADLNIMTAEWVGLASRTDAPVARTRAVLASTDPVALDYHVAKYLLYPNSRISLHDPDDPRSPLRQYLTECSKVGGAMLDALRAKAMSYDFRRRSTSEGVGEPILADIDWGTNPRALLKYLVLGLGLTWSREFNWLMGLIG